MSQYKTCKACEQALELSNFYNHATTKDRLMPVCKICHNARCRKIESKNREKRAIYWRNYYLKNQARLVKKSQDYRLANVEKIKIGFANWQKSNPEKSRVRSNRRRARKFLVASYRVSKKEVQRLKSANCFYCGGLGGCIDHVIPLSRGGSNGIGNYLPACIKCNSSKKDKTIMEWKKVRGW